MFGNFPRGDKCDIISDRLIKDEIQCLTKFKQRPTKRYIKKVCEIHKICFPKTYGNQYCGDYLSYTTRAIFVILLFSFLVMNNSLYHLLIFQIFHCATNFVGRYYSFV